MAEETSERAKTPDELYDKNVEPANLALCLNTIGQVKETSSLVCWLPALNKTGT